MAQGYVLEPWDRKNTLPFFISIFSIFIISILITEAGNTTSHSCRRAQALLSIWVSYLVYYIAASPQQIQVKDSACND